MKFSLILATKDRINEVKNFMISLQLQTYKNFELIVVDQNKDDRIKRIINTFKDNKNRKIIHIKAKPGLSRARNIALMYASGDIIAFPDDDCIYPPTLLANVKDFFFKHKQYDILSGIAIDPKNLTIAAGRVGFKRNKLSPLMLRVVSFAMYIRRSAVESSHVFFDEDFGIGGRYKSDEENDFVFRLLLNNKKGYYDPEKIFVFHPAKDFDFTNFSRAYNYGIGYGAFCRKHIKSIYGLLHSFRCCLLTPQIGIFEALLHFNTTKTRFYINKLKGRWKGFFYYKHY